MNDDFVAELGILAIGVRLKRISDALVQNGRVLYKQLNIDIEPNWYLIFKLLARYERLTVMEIAARLRFSHPSVINIIDKMKSRGFVTATVDKIDSRKQWISLSSKGRRTLPRLEEVWAAAAIGIEKTFSVPDAFLEELAHVEKKYLQHDFKDRTLAELGVLPLDSISEDALDVESGMMSRRND